MQVSHVAGHKKAEPATARVMGIDLSLASTGVAVLHKTRGLSTDGHLERVITKPADWEKTTTGRSARLDYITDTLIQIHEAFDPDLVAIEAPSFASQHGAAHDRAGLWWRVMKEMLAFGPVATVPPSSLKKYATGNGSVAKAVVTEMAKDTYGWITDWPEGKVDDIADAEVLAAMGMRWLGLPVERDIVSEVRIAALDGVEWPDGVAA